MQWSHWNRGLARAVATALVVALSVTACDDDDDPIVPPPSNGEETEATVQLAMADDAAEEETTVSGDFEADVVVQLWVDDDWQDLTGLSQTGVTFALGGAEEMIASTEVEPDTYDEARVLITNASATVAAGSQYGEADPLEEDVTVTIAEGDEVVLEHSTPVQVMEDGTVRLTVNLNSHIWLTEEAVDTGDVPATEFEGAVQLTSN